MNDYTALVVAEHNEVKWLLHYKDRPLGNWTEKDSLYILRYIHRFKLGTTYTEIAEKVRELMKKLIVKPSFDPAIEPFLVIDGTGVGEGVFEIFLSRAENPGR